MILYRGVAIVWNDGTSVWYCEIWGRLHECRSEAGMLTTLVNTIVNASNNTLAKSIADTNTNTAFESCCQYQYQYFCDNTFYCFFFQQHSFLPRCMECRRGLAMRFLSVRLSVKRMHCDKTEEKSVQIFIQRERSFSLVLWEEEWLVGATPSVWNFGSTGARWSEIADFQPIIARSASAIRPS